MTATDAKAARLLWAVEKMTKIRESAAQAQLSAIKSAAAAGIPVTHIAQSADMSRQHIHRLIAQ
ncbi:hypothetical protein [Mycobacteroides abscessus]|uniref:hypothetical protein n=1 Tax=Mycobacteroides abscessus TaxID=36809 RepID=UPI000E6A0299|nr:hypothetical protein [Mycobacteroides abscessus]RIS79114.1 hypothetical protein D2E44_20825 [Mycobacteroides abscessus]